MAISALVLQVLISGPGDLPDEHREVIHSATRSWNAAYGRTFGVVFNPVDWQESASPSFGQYAQDVLNEQIVDESDTAIVILTDRMGSPTPDHPSGTAEEVERLLEGGKEVAVYLNNCPRAPSRGTEAQTQRTALEEYVTSLRKRAFTGSYTSTAELHSNLSALLPRIANKFRREAEAALAPERSEDEDPSPPAAEASQDVPDSHEGIWPRLEVTESPSTDSKGRLRTKRRWYLVLESTVPRPVNNVRYRYEDGEGNVLDDFSLQGGRNAPIETLPPRGSAKFPVLRAWGSPSQAICVVQWEDQGKARTTRATVRAA